MSCSNKACLATLLLAIFCSVPGQALADDWDSNKSEGPSGIVASSGNSETFPQEEAPD